MSDEIRMAMHVNSCANALEGVTESDKAIVLRRAFGRHTLEFRRYWQSRRVLRGYLRKSAKDLRLLKTLWLQAAMKGAA